MTNIAGVILAGGKSSRMGEDKANLSLNGKTLLQQMQALLHNSGIEKIYISSSKSMTDIIKDCGPLSGIHASLSNISNTHKHILFVPVDMPALEPHLIKKLILAAKKADLIYFKSHRMPFLISNKKQWQQLAKTQLENNNDFSLNCFMKSIPNHYQIETLPKEHIYFENINEPKEWRIFQKRVKQ